ncbi:MAG: Na+/H+ antiporter subunit E [Bacteroidota bacterium]|nr:Na+/H+ antiporter subunit E [Bacteroidota bacterium]
MMKTNDGQNTPKSMTTRAAARPGWFWRPVRILRFALFYAWELLLSNLRIAHDILTPRHRFRPGIVRVAVPELTDRQMLVLNNLITMTPGTLSLDFSADRRTMYLHCMYIDDPERLRRDVLDSFVCRIREIF